MVFKSYWMKRYFIIIPYLFFFWVSCGQRIPKKYEKKINNCCRDDSLLASLINIEGYFHNQIVLRSRPNDTINIPILFYSNGLCVSNWGIYEANKQKFLNEVINGEHNDFYTNIPWGCYHIEGNKIIITTIVPGTAIRPTGVGETQYQVVDRNTIQQVFSASLKKSTSKTYELNEERSDFIYLPAKFRSLDRIPSSEHSWLSKKLKCK